MSMGQKELDALLAAPALDPPGNIEPNFENPPNHNGLAWFVTTFCIAVATLCVLIRIYARIWVMRKIHFTEICMFLAFGSFGGTAYAAYEMLAAPGYYVHQWNLVNGDLIRPLYLILVYGCCYSTVLPLIKTAILLDWCRVFVAADKVHSPFWWGCISLSVFQCVWGLLCVVLLNMQCRPHNAIWEFYVPAKCYSLPSVMLGSASVQVVTDFCMVLLPQRLIWSLHMNWQKKLGVALLFGVGLIACIAACFRLSNTITFAKEADRMYFIGPLLFWAWAEMTAGFFIFSVPCLPKLLADSPLPRKIKSVLGLSKSNTNPGSGGRSNPIATIGGTGGSKPSKKTRNGHIELREDGVTMTDMERSESQEQLHHGKQYGYEGALNPERGITVMRTTQVTESFGSHSDSDLPDNKTPWTRQIR